MQDVRSATEDYESWMRSFTGLSARELADKHTQMANDQFRFMRATFYRWAQQFPIVCPDLAAAPAGLFVGDIHLENYGLWRDAEGRLVWGINDFDEAAVLPYTSDLVRLVTSVALAPRPPDTWQASQWILDGYRESLNAEGRPFVLAERNRFLYDRALLHVKRPREYWNKLTALPAADDVPEQVRDLVRAAMPADTTGLTFRRRVAGLGSLGRPRVTATADWAGGLVAREVKRVLPSAWHWATGTSGPVQYERILATATRAADPFLRADRDWVVRRLAPDTRRLELSDHGPHASSEALLSRMGAELANVHRGDAAADDVRHHLTRLDTKSVHAGVKAMVQCVRADQDAFRKLSNAARHS